MIGAFEPWTDVIVPLAAALMCASAAVVSGLLAAGAFVPWKDAVVPFGAAVIGASAAIVAGLVAARYEGQAGGRGPQARL
jgi:hypothetical protein